MNSLSDEFPIIIIRTYSALAYKSLLYTLLIRVEAPTVGKGSDGEG